MIRAEHRIVIAAVAVFVSLGGMVTAIRGLLFDLDSLTRYGVIIAGIGVACLAFMLNPRPTDRP
ncbi:DUF2964 family protein [Paraburkholderia sp. BL10I2N1]|uniref:DUF2964 family protein n=1 Tax=Paraburkholderia sp. BL10I2N1 TaxID=1938796 RepID=UPI00105CFC7D|nr:DUF2964 family protein [Paraburkholderia sp. BL10I2N1]TDN63206.1 DUF2964 family protein [Paraburkholderia sp. BL10I2N1]